MTDQRFSLSAPSGVTAVVSTYGAGLTELSMPGRDGHFDDVVLGFDTPGEYVVHANRYLGCTVGRVAQRIRRARFVMDGTTYRLAANDGRNALHGGSARSFDKVVWEAEKRATPSSQTVTLRYVSGHMEEGYPGTLHATVAYTLTDRDDFLIDFSATADARTPVNMTNHTYWNLRGAGAGSILDHQLEIDAADYTPVDDELIPNGTVASVDGTPFDFRSPCAIGARVDTLTDGPMLGYDLNYVLTDRSELAFAARLSDPGSGRMVECWTDQPCLQLYSGNFLTSTRGKHGRMFGYRGGVCLEPQGYPDAVNNPGFPPPWLEPGHTYRRTIMFRLRHEGPQETSA